MYTAEELEAAQRIVYAAMPPTPQYAWPLLAEAAGCETWVKHENHTPTGAFKVRGGLVHMKMRKDRGETNGVITATRGNHGQSIPFAASRVGISATIVCPIGNSPEKNAAMRALGAELIETGHDFDAARETAMEIAKDRGLDFIPSFGKELVMGVTTYAHELFRAAGELDTVYVPIGMGSGIVGTIAARDMLGLFADGMAVRGPHPAAVDIICRGAADVVRVTEDAVAEAVRLYYEATHNLAEGAGAAPLAALMSDPSRFAGRKIGLILSGGNVDRPVYAEILAGRIPVA